MANNLPQAILTNRHPRRLSKWLWWRINQRSGRAGRGSSTRFLISACVCACNTGEEALRIIPEEQPDVVLMDIFLPRMSGIECTARLKALLPQTQIVISTAMDDQELVFMALEAGADGYLLKRTKPSDLRTALLDVLGGGAPMTSQMPAASLNHFGERQSPG